MEIDFGLIQMNNPLKSRTTNMTLVKFRPSNAVANPSISNLFDSFFNENVGGFWGREFHLSNPAVNISEDQAGFLLEVAAPGFQKEDFEIAVNHNQLTIKGKLAEAISENTDGQPRKFTRREFHFSKFERSFTLPNTVDAERISANYLNGILNISIPKKEEAKERLPRTIQIS